MGGGAGDASADVLREVAHDALSALLGELGGGRVRGEGAWRLARAALDRDDREDETQAKQPWAERFIT
ncbi:hypothetical protein DAT35_03735 [Vitiosangium sp. GDMCC 1.1324]|nr:hypothetical protein DAT35_03735 [Vitiosangium sp. GDMCC 1.1324]